MVVRHLGLELGFIVGLQDLFTFRRFLRSLNSILQVEPHTLREDVGNDVVLDGE